MNYEDADGLIRRTATAVASAHIALIVLDVSVLASSLPNVYVSDLAANCGARNLAAFSSHYILVSGLFAISAIFITLAYSGFIWVRQIANTLVKSVGQSFLLVTFLALGFVSLAFFASAGRQLERLGYPPHLPPDFEKTHVCPAYSPD